MDLLERISELEQRNTVLQQLEQTISRNAHLFDVLLSRGQDSIVLLAPDLTILRVVHSVLGHSENRTVGLSFATFVHPDETPRLQEVFSGLLKRQGETETAELHCRIQDAQGAWIWMEMKFTDMLDDPQIQAIVMNGRRTETRNRRQT